MQNSRNIKETSQALLNNQFIFGLYIWRPVRQFGIIFTFFSGFTPTSFGCKRSSYFEMISQGDLTCAHAQDNHQPVQQQSPSEIL